jgi:hypothetical protein
VIADSSCLVSDLGGVCKLAECASDVCVCGWLNELVKLGYDEDISFSRPTALFKPLGFIDSSAEAVVCSVLGFVLFRRYLS